MKNTIYLDSDFNFLLLENEEEDNGLTQTKIYINIPTSAAANQALEISVAGGAPITESIPSSAKVNFELSQQYWADNGDVEITPKNDDVTGDTITIHFPETFTVSAALNYLFDDEFEIVAQNENFAEGGSGSGSGSGGGSAFDFVEAIRNIGFRLLDEPSNVNAYFDEIAEEVRIKWTDPADISTNEPAPATWAGTVVVRKEGSAPKHRWDGTLIIDSTTRDEYSVNALMDDTIESGKTYYYGIFPYDTKGDYRYTKVIYLGKSSSVNLVPLGDIVEASDLSNYKSYKNASFTPSDISELSEYFLQDTVLQCGLLYSEDPETFDGNSINFAGKTGREISYQGLPYRYADTDGYVYIPINRSKISKIQCDIKFDALCGSEYTEIGFVYDKIDIMLARVENGTMVRSAVLISTGYSTKGDNILNWDAYTGEPAAPFIADYVVFKKFNGAPNVKNIMVEVMTDGA